MKSCEYYISIHIICMFCLTAINERFKVSLTQPLPPRCLLPALQPLQAPRVQALGAHVLGAVRVLLRVLLRVPPGPGPVAPQPGCHWGIN